MLMLLGCLGASAQQSVVRQDIVRPIHALKIWGHSNVEIFYDSVTFVEVTCPRPQSECNYFISVEDNTLIINDTTGQNRYKLHVVASLVTSVSTDQNATVVYPNGASSFEFNSGSLRNTVDQLKVVIDELVSSLESAGDNGAKVDAKSAPAPAATKSKKRQYSVSDRSDLDFLWAFNNWGDQMYNGLMKMDGAYELRTSFSSYQLAYNYAVVMTKHFQLKVGLGYESDVYKFANPYVSTNAAGQFVAIDATGIDAVCGVSATNLNDWSTRFVARYITLPVQLTYRDIGILKSWRFSLGVVPGLSFTTRHTGLKHELDRPGKNYQDAESLSGFVNPLKCDIRLSVKRNLFGFFVQLPTMPMFVETGQKVYPIKIGFVL